MIVIIKINSESIEKAAVPATIVRGMYDLLSANMTEILGASGPDWRSDAAFIKWKNEVFLGGVQKHTNHLLVLDEQGLRGFISYTAMPGGAEIYLNEVQIRPSCRGDGVTLRRLIQLFADRARNLPQEWIVTYSNKANTRAQELAEKAGFERFGETERGYRYRMRKTRLVERFGVRLQPDGRIEPYNRLWYPAD